MPTDRRAREVAGMTLERIGNIKAAVARTTGQRKMEVRASGEADAQKQP